MGDHVSAISSHSPNGANVTKKVAQSGPRSETQGLCSLFRGYAAYPTFGQAFRFVGSDPSERVRHCLPPPEPRTGLRVRFSPNPEPWTGPGSGSPGFGSEPRFRTGLRHHYAQQAPPCELLARRPSTPTDCNELNHAPPPHAQRKHECTFGLALCLARSLPSRPVRDGQTDPPFPHHPPPTECGGRRAGTSSRDVFQQGSRLG